MPVSLRIGYLAWEYRRRSCISGRGAAIELECAGSADEFALDIRNARVTPTLGNALIEVVVYRAGIVVVECPIGLQGGGWDRIRSRIGFRNGDGQGSILTGKQARNAGRVECPFKHGEIVDIALPVSRAVTGAMVADIHATHRQDGRVGGTGINHRTVEIELRLVRRRYAPW